MEDLCEVIFLWFFWWVCVKSQFWSLWEEWSTNIKAYMLSLLYTNCENTFWCDPIQYLFSLIFPFLITERRKTQPSIINDKQQNNKTFVRFAGQPHLGKEKESVLVHWCQFLQCCYTHCHVHAKYMLEMLTVVIHVFLSSYTTCLLISLFFLWKHFLTEFWSKKSIIVILLYLFFFPL
jgi:hypothetical protein